MWIADKGLVPMFDVGRMGGYKNNTTEHFQFVESCGRGRHWFLLPVVDCERGETRGGRGYAAVVLVVIVPASAYGNPAKSG